MKRNAITILAISVFFNTVKASAFISNIRKINAITLNYNSDSANIMGGLRIMDDYDVLTFCNRISSKNPYSIYDKSVIDLDTSKQLKEKKKTNRIEVVLEVGYGLEIFKNHLYDNVIYKDAQFTYSGQYGSFGRGNIAQVGLNIPLAKNIYLQMSYIQLFAPTLTQTTENINTTFTYSETIKRYAQTGGMNFLIKTKVKYFSFGLGAIYLPKISLHQDSSWIITYSDPNSPTQSVSTKGLYENKNGALGLSYRSEINIPISSRIGLTLGLQGYLINFKPDTYKTTAKEAVNVSNTSSTSSKSFSSASNNSSNIAPTFILNNIFIFAGLCLKL